MADEIVLDRDRRRHPIGVEVDTVGDWGGKGPRLRIDDGSDSITVAPEELEEFLLQVGEAVSQLGYFDAKELLQFIIRSVREKAPS